MNQYQGKDFVASMNDLLSKKQDYMDYHVLRSDYPEVEYEEVESHEIIFNKALKDFIQAFDHGQRGQGDDSC